MGGSLIIFCKNVDSKTCANRDHSLCDSEDDEHHVNSGVAVAMNDDDSDHEAVGEASTGPPTVPIISLADMDSDVSVTAMDDDISDHDAGVTRVARRRLVILGAETQVDDPARVTRDEHSEDEASDNPTSDTDSMISRDGHSDVEGAHQSRHSLPSQSVWRGSRPVSSRFRP